MIREMIEKGATVSSIARDMGIDRKTVRKYASSDTVSAYTGRHRATKQPVSAEHTVLLFVLYTFGGDIDVVHFVSSVVKCTAISTIT